MVFSDRIQDLKLALLSGVVLAALALVGAFQLAGAAAAWVEALGFSAAAASAIVGAIAFAPILIVYLAGVIGAALKRARQEAGSLDAPDLPEQVRELVDMVQRLTRTAPIAAVALALIAGFMLMRSPGSLPLVISAFAASRAA